jgi:hypothetical protein
MNEILHDDSSNQDYQNDHLMRQDSRLSLDSELVREETKQEINVDDQNISGMLKKPNLQQK